MSSNNSNGLRISFFGASQEVTGSNFLLSHKPVSGKETKMLIDCGFFQGSKVSEDRNYDNFSYDTKSIDALIATHAHLDHIGRIPKLVNEGFKGKIFSTPATRDLARIMLIDSLGVLEKELKKNKNKIIYKEEDVEKTMKQWETIDYNQEFSISDFKVKFLEAGHILGSAMAEIVVGSPSSPSGQEKIVFTGDLGNPLTPLLRDPEPIKDADYLIIESTYGDREHEGREDASLKLERVIEEAMHNGGVLMIPAFSLERTQKILYEINNFAEHGSIPKIPIFLDSPLSIKATEIYKKYQNYFNEEAKEIIRSGDELFKFPGLKLTLTSEESKWINDVPSPKIIIAGSGMSNGGRIIHHEHRYLNNPKNTLLIVSFQAAGSLGRQLEEGAKTVNILGDIIPVNARVETIRGFSCHPDTNELYDFVRHSADSLKKMFVVHGELKSSTFFSQRVRDCLGIDVTIPRFGDSFELK